MVAVECLVSSSRDVVTLHECLCEVLRAFENGTSLRRTDDRNVLCALIVQEVVVDTLNKWILWTYNYHVYVILNDE